MIGTTELVLLSGLALLLFGGKKLPEMMRGLGQGVKEFKKGMKDSSDPEKTEEDNHSLNNTVEDQVDDTVKEEQSDTFNDGKTKE